MLTPKQHYINYIKKVVAVLWQKVELIFVKNKTKQKENVIYTEPNQLDDNLQIIRFRFFPQDSWFADLVEKVVMIFGEVTNAVFKWAGMFSLTLPAAGDVNPKHQAVAWPRVVRVVDRVDVASDAILPNGGKSFCDQGRDLDLRVPILESGHRFVEHPVLPEIIKVWCYDLQEL